MVRGFFASSSPIDALSFHNTVPPNPTNPAPTSQPVRPAPSCDLASVDDPFACFHSVTADWFRAVFDAPTAPQRLGWPVIARGESALILAPTGTGKTLTAFLWCLDRLMLRRQGLGTKGLGTGCRIVYVSPLKAL